MSRMSMSGTAPQGRRPSVAALFAGALLGAAALAVPSAAVADPATTDLQILSFNDYHGNLEPPTGSNGRLPGQPSTTFFGGVEYLSSTLTQLRAGHRNTLTVAAGDLIGASPIVSGLFHDEPGIESLNALKLDVSSVGNHEFDEGVTELLRMQYGGCRADTGCYQPTGFPGARFPYLAANVVYKDGVTVPRVKGADDYGSWFRQSTGRTVLPPTWVKEVGDVKVGFIGMTLKGTPELVAQAGIRDVDFRDEVATANLAAADLSRRGVKAIVVLIHEGGLPPSGAAFDYPCNSAGGTASISGPIVAIAQNLSPAIDLVVSGHTHQPYTCMIPDPAGNPRSVTSASSYGRLVTETNLLVDRRTKDVVRSSVTAVNHPVVRTIAADPVESSIVTRWQTLAAPIASRPVGTITADITRSTTRDGESSLADLIADAQLDRTVGNGAQIALMNPGGVRDNLTYAGSATGGADGQVTYGEAFSVQPFANTLVTMTLTGAQLHAVLEQQLATRSGVDSMLALGISKGLTFTWSASAAKGSKIDPASITLNGVAVDPAASYRVTVNSFLADGGDSFTTFVQGTSRIGGGVDLDEFVAWLGANSPVTGPTPNRMQLVP
jgi:5'-nucleotidase